MNVDSQKSQYDNIEKILMQSDILYKNWFERFLALEEYCTNIPSLGEIYNYKFPFTNATFSINNKEFHGQKYSKIILTINGNVHSVSKIDSMLDVARKCEDLQNALENNKLTFCPIYNKEFYQELRKIEQGSRCILNTRMSLVCVEKDDYKSIFQNVFNGGFRQFTIEQFEQLPKFTISNNSEQDVQYLYSKAFDVSSMKANIRVKYNDISGYETINKIESKLQEGQTAYLHIGSLNLDVTKKDNEIIWLINHKKVCKDFVANIYGTVESLPTEFHYYKFDLDNKIAIPVNTVSINDEFLKNAKEKNINTLIEKAFEYSNNYNFFSLGVSGYIENDNNYDACTFIFHNNKIYKVLYDNNILDMHNVKEIQEVNVEIFRTFLNQKYDKTYNDILIAAEESIKNYLKVHPLLNEEDVKNDFVKKTIEYIEDKLPDWNPLGIVYGEISDIDSELETIIDSYDKINDAQNAHIHGE